MPLYEIRRKAIELLIRHEMSELPIKPLLICQKEKIIVHKYDLLGQDGYCYFSKKHNKWCIVISINTNRSSRIRFTLAHELGHIILRHEHHDDVSEKEANLFADELLIPTEILIHKRLDDPVNISREFNVSLEAAENKLKFLRQNSIYAENMAYS
jgi:Zn-dependent peptidase ImmA (M78 family)